MVISSTNEQIQNTPLLLLIVGYRAFLFSDMIVEILKSDDRLGVKKGQIYKAKIYLLDPDKVTLLRRLTKKDRKPVGKEPMVNQYLSEVSVLNDL